jgi:hypothetical protein
VLCTLLLNTGTAQESATTPVFDTTSNRGLHLVFSPTLQPLEINRIHAWQLRLTDREGEPVSGARISITGGMPEHDHGMPTRPVASEETTSGNYLLQGMRFHMPGLWRLDIIIETDSFRDSAALELTL